MFDISDSGSANVNSITTGSTKNGTLTISGDYNFKLNGKLFKLGNVDAAADIVFTYNSKGKLSLDLSEVVAANRKVLN